MSEGNMVDKGIGPSRLNKKEMFHLENRELSHPSCEEVLSYSMDYVNNVELKDRIQEVLAK